MDNIILRYGEINLKGKNRSFFERTLINNVKQKLQGYTHEIQKYRNRLIIKVKQEDQKELYDSFLKLPGIENISLAKECKTEYEEIIKNVLEVFDKSKPCFRVSTKRSNKDFEYSSQEFSKIVGGHILRENDGLKGLKVSMKDYDQEIGIEILKDKTYIFHKKTTAMGGLPIGSSGKAMVLLSGGIDSPTAAIEAMKRGIKINCVHFSTPPYTTKESVNKVLLLVDVLKEYDSSIKFFNFNITEAQLEIKEKCEDKYTLLLMRRLMYKKTSDFAKKKDFKMIVTGESIGQVASQTIESITMTNLASDIPVIRPLITHNKNEIITKAKKYGTYEISIMPFEDACTVFAPKRPETKPKIQDILKEEEKVNIPELINKIKLEESLKLENELEDYL